MVILGAVLHGGMIVRLRRALGRRFVLVLLLLRRCLVIVLGRGCRFCLLSAVFVLMLRRGG
jgi:hypothetical protein